ncbi:hypothetical protein D7V82_04935 [bacterium 1xD8-6]|nr:hypothetical protein D7V72_05615 [bacterium D16-36]RKI71914.1 hypothetical protein D7V82_04935 [bacterium 1xD8-6]
MGETEGNKKCLFLSYFWTMDRKNGMAVEPVKNVFFYRLKFSFFIMFADQSVYRWAALYLASGWMQTVCP